MTNSTGPTDSQASGEEPPAPAKRQWSFRRRQAQTEHQKNEALIARWTRRLGILTILTVFIAGGTAYILWETDQTVRLRDRAFIYFTDPTIHPYPPDKPIVWAFGVGIFNAGNLPARRVTVRYACPNVAPGEAADVAVKSAKWESAELASVLGPKNAVTVVGCHLDIDLVQTAQRFERLVYIFLEAKYLDGFYLDKERVTLMSRILRFDQWGGRSLGFFGPNCTDDDCPKTR